MATLYQLTGQMKAIEESLEENCGELTPELEALWEETAETLPAKVDGYNHVIKNIELLAKGYDEEIKRIQALKKAADNSVKRIKEHIKDVMIANNIDKLDGKACKFSLTSSTSTDVDEVTILQPYNEKIDTLRASLPSWISIETKVSKTELKNAFKDKDITPAGVTFIKNTTLKIR